MVVKTILTLIVVIKEIFKIYNQGKKKQECQYKLSHHKRVEMSVPNTLSFQKLRCYVRLFGYWLIFPN